MLTSPVASFLFEPVLAVGFLPFRGSVMLDFVAVAMLLVLVVLAGSVALVKITRAYTLHAYLQIALAVILLVAVAAFEIDVRFFTNWRELAEASPYYNGETFNTVTISLYIHLCFAIPTPILWLVVIVRAVRNFGLSPLPGAHSHAHKFWAWIATAGMTLTALTGWVFYYLAFVA